MADQDHLSGGMGGSPGLASGGEGMLLGTSCMPGGDDEDDAEELEMLRSMAAGAAVPAAMTNAPAPASPPKKPAAVVDLVQPPPVVCDAGGECPEIAGQRNLQSTVNPAPLDILQSKVLLRKDSGLPNSHNHNNNGCGANSPQQQQLGEEQQWGSVVKKPMKANQGFYATEGGSDAKTSSVHGLPPLPVVLPDVGPKRDFPDIAEEESITIEGRSGNYTPARDRSPPTIAIVPGGPLNVSTTTGLGVSVSGLTNANTTAPSSTNSLLPQRANSGVVDPTSPKKP